MTRDFSGTIHFDFVVPKSLVSCWENEEDFSASSWYWDTYILHLQAYCRHGVDQDGLRRRLAKHQNDRHARLGMFKLVLTLPMRACCWLGLGSFLTLDTQACIVSY